MSMVTVLADPAQPWWHGGWGHDGGPGWWVVFPITFGLFWIAVLVGGFLLLWRRMPGRGPHETHETHGTRGSAEATLAERFARGEIDADEYHERLAVLRG